MNLIDSKQLRLASVKLGKKSEEEGGEEKGYLSRGDNRQERQ